MWFWMRRHSGLGGRWVIQVALGRRLAAVAVLAGLGDRAGGTQWKLNPKTLPARQRTDAQDFIHHGLAAAPTEVIKSTRNRNRASDYPLGLANCTTMAPSCSHYEPARWRPGRRAGATTPNCGRRSGAGHIGSVTCTGTAQMGHSSTTAPPAGWASCGRGQSHGAEAWVDLGRPLVPGIRLPPALPTGTRRAARRRYLTMIRRKDPMAIPDICKRPTATPSPGTVTAIQIDKERGLVLYSVRLLSCVGAR